MPLCTWKASANRPIAWSSQAFDAINFEASFVFLGAFKLLIYDFLCGRQFFAHFFSMRKRANSAK